LITTIAIFYLDDSNWWQLIIINHNEFLAKLLTVFQGALTFIWTLVE